MVVKLAISSKDLDEDDLQEITIDMRRTLVDETDIKAELIEGASEKGSRGEPITLGLIALTFLSSGAAVALFNVFKSFFDRKKSLEVEITREDGTKINIKSENIKLEDLKKFLGN